MTTTYDAWKLAHGEDDPELDEFGEEVVEEDPDDRFERLREARLDR